MEKNIIHISSDLEPLIPRYLENRRADIATLYEALQVNNIEIVRSIGHTIKGSGASYGLEEISVIGRTLEDAAKSSDTTQIQTSITRLEHFLETLEIIFVEDMP
jgi:HPt (histidine-containing phosphotransfer) domain-containing protein